ncbi:MAG: hypothetical protein MI924_20040 [Chloroflexales bacterium]|nr:hypothetical protein [Chloroflexales bacterium]
MVCNVILSIIATDAPVSDRNVTCPAYLTLAGLAQTGAAHNVGASGALRLADEDLAFTIAFTADTIWITRTAGTSCAQRSPIKPG